MNISMIVWGPVVLVVAVTTLLIWSEVITFGEQAPGLEHQAGVPEGGTFLTVTESTEPAETTESESFSDVAGLELEEESIEYRDGMEKTTKTKQPGLTKYANIHINTSKLKDLIFWNWVIDGTAVDTGVEMKQIDPPVLVIPAQ